MSAFSQWYRKAVLTGTWGRPAGAVRRYVTHGVCVLRSEVHGIDQVSGGEVTLLRRQRNASCRWYLGKLCVCVD